MDLTTTEAAETDSVAAARGWPSRARVWPLVLVACIQAALLLVCVTPSIDNFVRFVTLMAGPLVCGALFAAALLALSRLRWWESTFVLLCTVVMGSIAAAMAAHRTGIAFWMYGVPLTMLMITVGLFVVRSAEPNRRLASMVSFSAIGWIALSLLRVDGIDGNYVPELAWRWTPTAEDRLLAEMAASPTPPLVSAADWKWTTLEWPGFRGVKRDSRAPGGSSAQDWQRFPPAVLWQRRVGPAWSSMSIVSDRLFTQEQRGDMEVVACYDALSGDPIWEHQEPSRFEEVTSGAGPRATPTFGDGHIYAYGAKAILIALDAASGSPIWRHDLMQEVGAPLPVWGFSSSPLVVDDLVIIYAGGRDENGLMAFDRATGDLSWAIPSQGMNFGSAMLAEIDGVQTVVFVESGNAMGLDPKSGNEQWRYRFGEQGENPPIVQPQQIGPTSLAVPLGDGVGVARIELTRNADDTWFVEESWKSRDLKPSFNDFVYHNGFLYGFDKEIFACVDATTGKRAWKRGRYGFGQVILLEARGQLVVTTEQGDIVLIDADPEEMTERGRVSILEGKTWNHPAVAEDRLYVRNAEAMVCIALSDAAPLSMPPNKTD